MALLTGQAEVEGEKSESEKGRNNLHCQNQEQSGKYSVCAVLRLENHRAHALWTTGPIPQLYTLVSTLDLGYLHIVEDWIISQRY